MPLTRPTRNHFEDGNVEFVERSKSYTCFEPKAEQLQRNRFLRRAPKLINLQGSRLWFGNAKWCTFFNTIGKRLNQSYQNYNILCCDYKNPIFRSSLKEFVFTITTPRKLITLHHFIDHTPIIRLNKKCCTFILNTTNEE